MGDRRMAVGRARRAGRVARVAAGVALASAATCSGGGHEGEGAPAAGELRVLSYNVAGLPQEISTVDPEEHIPLISPRLAPYDVVLTQEDFDWWQGPAADLDFVNYHDRLRAQAPHLHATDRHPGPEAVGLDPDSRPLQVGDGLGVLSRLPFTGETRVPWEGCFGGVDTSDGGAGDCLAMKGFAMVDMALTGEAGVHVYTLHAEAGSTARDQRLQAADFEQLAAFIDRRSAGRAVILGGDTNLHTGGAHPDAAGTADREIWRVFLGRTGLTDACDATGCAEPGAIDKIAYRSGGGVRLEATAHDFPRRRFRSPAGDDLSDHPPLEVEIAWELTG